jgi:starvation-inducible outer membrane lipoprotein
MLGGDILSACNLGEVTLLEMLQKPLEAMDRPIDMDWTKGCFMILCEGYPDPEVWEKLFAITSPRSGWMQG